MPTSNPLPVPLFLLTTLLAATAAIPAERSCRAQDQATREKSKPTIVFLGDSITEAGAGPSGYVTLLKNALQQRHPDLACNVIGAGISGNRVPDLQSRLDKDVLAHKPNVVVIYIGINDVWHSLHGKGTPIEQFESGLSEIIGKIQKNGGKVILCTPSVIGEKTDGSNQLDKKLEEYATVSRKVAQKTGSLLLDLRQLFLRELAIRNTELKADSVLTTDGVHLNDAGNAFVKDCLLSAVESQLGTQVVRHIVLVKFKPTANQAAINQVCDGLRQLKQDIPQVVDIEGGYDISPEMRNEGYTHGFLLTFHNPTDRDTYLVHPAHEAFKKMAMAHVAGVVVVDFFAPGE